MSRPRARPATRAHHPRTAQLSGVQAPRDPDHPNPFASRPLDYTLARCYGVAEARARQSIGPFECVHESDDKQEDRVDRPYAIALPKLLHTTVPPSSYCYASDAWADLAQTYDETAKADEQARKARRDAYRSRMKALSETSTYLGLQSP